MNRKKPDCVLVSSASEVKTEDVEDASEFRRQWLIGEESGADCFMRKFTVDEDGEMPLHRHDNLEHIQYILKGRIRVRAGDEVYVAERDDFLFIPRGVPHKYENLSDGESQFVFSPQGDPFPNP